MALFGQSTAFGSAAPVAAPGGAFGSTLATAAPTANPMKDIALNNCPGKRRKTEALPDSKFIALYVLLSNVVFSSTCC